MKKKQQNKQKTIKTKIKIRGYSKKIYIYIRQQQEK